MPDFSNLDSVTQDLIMLNFEFFAKKVILFLAIACSLYYIFHYWKNKKESNFILVGIWRILLYICSFVCLVSTPLFIFWLYPQAPIDTPLKFILLFYTIGFFVVGAIVSLNIFYYGISVTVGFAGVKLDSRVDRGWKRIYKETIQIMGFKLKR